MTWLAGVLVVVVGTLLTADIPAQARATVARVGTLYSTASSGPQATAFRAGLRERGWIIGSTVVLEERWAEGDVKRLVALVGEMVRLAPDVIVVETTPGARAAARATHTIPIVFTYVSDPVGAGLVRTLARPGGNVTGFTNVLAELSGKLLELLRETVPSVARVAVLWNPENPAKVQELRELEGPARVLGVELRPYPIRSAGDIEAAFRGLAGDRPDGVVILADALTAVHARRMAGLAADHRLPTVFNFAPHVEAGGLLAYAPDFSDLYDRVAGYVDRILRGSKAAELPVERPTRFRLTVNLGAAKALGLRVPPSILMRADRVIE